jgi:trigger factor
MDISKKTVDPYAIDATISLTKEELAVYLEQASQALSQHVTIDGFRKGKAPKDLVQKKLDPGVIRQEALEYALGDSFTKASVQEGWDVMRTMDLKVVKNDADGLEYSVRVQLWPALELPDLTTVKVPGKNIEVSDTEIQESLDTVLNMRATFLDKTGPAAEGDRVEIDFDAQTDGQPVEGGQSKNHPLIIGGKNFMPGFEEALIGLASGDSKQFSLVAPADYYEPKLAGKKIDFSVTVHRVQAVLKPAADDDFAKSLGANFQNIDQLKGNLREGIYNEKLNKERQRLRLAILDAVVAGGKIPAPEAMVADEMHDMVHRFSDDLRRRGVELAMYLARLKKTEDDLRKDWKPEAERQVRIRLALRRIAKDKNITVGDEELEGAVKDTIAELMQSGQITEDQVDPERVRNALAERIMTDKTLQFIEGVCAVPAKQE